MYVPPSKRAGYTAPSSSTLPPDYKPRFTPGKPRAETYTRYFIGSHFTHPLDSTLTFFSHPLPPLMRPPRPAYDPSRTPEDTPLPPSPEVAPAHPLRYLVSYISLFRNGHPDWESANELWIHTGAEQLMEEYGTDEAPGKRWNFGRPIPLFKETPRKDNFEFDGWYQIDKMRVVPPESDELRELLHRKEEAKSYNSGGRSASAWAESFSHQWVKLRLSRCSSTSEHYTTLENPMKLKGGVDGEVERYLLKVRGLEDLAVGKLGKI